MKWFPLNIVLVITFISLLAISLAFVILSFSVVTSIFKPENTPLKETIWRVPIKMKSEDITDRVTYKDDVFKATHIKYTKVYIQVNPTEGKVFFRNMQYLGILGIYIIGFLCNYLLFHILASIKTNPFGTENLSRITQMGFLVIGGELYRFFLSLFFSHTVVKNMDIQGIEIAPIGWTDLNFAILILGITILAIGEVFRRGSVLQENENLTV